MITPARIVEMLLSEDKVHVQDVFGSLDELVKYASKRPNILGQFRIRQDAGPEAIRRGLAAIWSGNGTIEVS